MATTPEVLQKKFGLQPEMGSKAIPRVLYGFKGQRPSDKKNLLGFAYAAIMSGALPTEGGSRRVNQVSQEAMGQKCGVSRVTMTRLISKIATIAKSWNRKRAVETTPIIDRRRQFASPNKYTFLAPQREENWVVKETASDTIIQRFYDDKPAIALCDRLTQAAIAKALRSSPTGEPIKSYHVEALELNERQQNYPTIQELCEMAGGGGAYWDAEFHDKGFKEVDCWAWDERIEDPDALEMGRHETLDWLPRLVMSTYIMKGLLDEWTRPDGTKKSKGILDGFTQEYIAAYLGIDEKTLRRCNQKWIKLGVLRVAHECDEIAPKVWVSQPQRIVYLPFTQLTQKEAELESARMETKVREIVKQEGVRRLEQLLEAKRLGNELLASWQGSERHRNTFYREHARLLHEAKIDDDLICRFIPPSPPPQWTS